MMKRYKTSETSSDALRLLLSRPPLEEVEVGSGVSDRLAKIFGAKLKPSEAVARIVADVETHGDAAVVDYTERIDGVRLDPAAIFADEAEIAEAAAKVEPHVMEAIRHACRRVRTFHEAQIERSWFQEGPRGEILGQRVFPLQRVCCYVPGGRAALASTAIMSVVPAKVAGVDDVIVATPPGPDGKANPYVLTAAVESGADRVLKVGGAQAIAGVALGTTWIPKVDKIVGPGNIFVALAKKAVFGRVGIEALNGPSEIAVVADADARPDWVAADLLSQAEHDPEAAALLFSDSPELCERVMVEVERQLPALEREDVARESLARWGAVVECRSLEEACEWVDHLAPEHVELMVAEPWALIGRIRFAGAVFLGPHSTEPVGDYIAGPSHVLPTNGTARFSSPLGVYDFVRRSSLIAFGAEALGAVATDAGALAEIEGLGAHLNALRIRESGGAS